jgi:hypothetical protein
MRKGDYTTKKGSIDPKIIVRQHRYPVDTEEVTVINREKFLTRPEVSENDRSYMMTTRVVKVVSSRR